MKNCYGVEVVKSEDADILILRNIFESNSLS